MFFVLDQGQLGADKVGITPALILDQNELDTYGLSYNGYNSDLAYDNNFLTYDGAFVWQATASAQLNALTALATSVTVKFASATSSLGLLQAQALEAIENFAHGSADLQNLVSSAQIVISKEVSGFVNLGEIVSTANVIIQKQANANSNLGPILASAEIDVDNFYTASASLGALSATAQTQIPTPPTPEPSKYGSNGYAPIRKKKKEIQTIFEPEIPIIKITKPARPVTKNQKIKANTLAVIFDASAESQIDFSILEDEAELLLLI